MKLFKDNYFDFVLFSWYGIDYVEHEGRIKILAEINRVLKAGGILAFQTHNLNYQMKNCFIQLSKNPIILSHRINRLLLLRLLNRKEVWETTRSAYMKSQFILFRDETHDFGMATYSIRPIEQIKQLASLGFIKTRVDLKNGKEITNPAEAMDEWLYYLATKVGQKV